MSTDSRSSSSSDEPIQPPLKQSIKQKTVDVRNVREIPDGYRVVAMGKSRFKYPEPHHFTLTEKDMEDLVEKMKFESVEDFQEALPKNTPGMPCGGEGITVWIAHVQPGEFGWELSAVTNKGRSKHGG